MKNKIKTFVKTNKKTITFIGKVVLGVVVTVVVLGLSKELMMVRNSETLTDSHTEDFPTLEDTDPLRAHYNDENVLYANGLPVFANDEQTIVYRDAIDDEAIDDWLDMGGKIIDRV